MNGPTEINQGRRACAPPHPESDRERDDTYSRVVVRLDDSWCVVVCEDAIQWVLQRRRGGEWKGRSFHRERDSLIRVSDALCGGYGDRERAMLMAPPAHFRPSMATGGADGTVEKTGIRARQTRRR